MNPSEIQKIFGPPLKGHVSPLPLMNPHIAENTMLKKQNELLFTLLVIAGVAITLGYLHSREMKKEIRISTPEKNNLNTK